MSKKDEALKAWKSAYAAFKGAFDTPLARRRDDSIYANDARKRLRDFDEFILEALAEPSHTAQEPVAKVPGMAVQALAGEIIEALLADEKDGGYDLTAGLFGSKFSALVRRWAAAEWNTFQQPAQQEPVAEVARYDRIHWYDASTHVPVGTKLYTSPPASKPWVGLTEEETEHYWAADFVAGAKWAEVKLREKNAAQRKPLTDEWVPVTQSLLDAQHPWLYQPMWIALKGGVVVQGYYEWRQGRNPDRFITDLGDEWAFNADFVMPLAKPTPPTIEAHLKEKNT